MALAEDFARFADKLREGPSGLMSEITCFPSGAVSLRVRFSTSRVFDMEYFPSHQMLCVDELPEDAGFNTGYRFSYPDFESAKAKLLDLLDDAKRGLPQDR